MGSISAGTTPSLKAYDDDETFDTSNTVNLLVTDTSYYGITNYGDVDITDRLTYSYSASTTNPTHWVYTTSNIFTEFGIRMPGVFIAAGGIWGGVAPSSTATTYTVGNSTYYRGPLQTTTTATSGSITYTQRYYSVAVAQG